MARTSRTKSGTGKAAADPSGGGQRRGRSSEGAARPGDRHKLDKIFGKHSVQAALLQRPDAIRRLLVAGQSGYYSDILATCEARNIAVEYVDWPVFHKLGQFEETDKHQGIVAFADPLPIYGDGDLDRLAGCRTVLLLDQVTNPQNLATILRSAAFFHCDAVVLMRHRSVTITPTVLRFAVGGAEFVTLYKVTNLARSIARLQELGFWVYGLEGTAAASLESVAFPNQSALVVGAENEGLRPKTRRYCDALAAIPGGRAGLESLNAATAATLALYERHSQQAGAPGSPGADGGDDAG